MRAIDLRLRPPYKSFCDYSFYQNLETRRDEGVGFLRLLCSVTWT
mgnify:CR=1 FL=1